MKRRILAILLAAIMVLSAVPFSVFAEEATVACPGKGGIHTKDNCDYVKFAVKDPVCDKDGYTVYTCEGCGDQFVADVIPAKDTPHKLVKATKAATCNTTGIAENVWQCTVCEVYFKDAEAKDAYKDGDTSYVTDKLAHQYEDLKTDCTTQKCKLCGATKSTETAHDYEVIKFHTPAATCKDSAKADVKCKKCGDIQYNVSVASDVPHKLGELVAHKDPTCTTAGNVDYYQCKVCNKYFADANATTEIKDNKHIIAKLGHTTVGGFVISKTPATCIKTGKQTYQCGRCGQLIENEVIPACPEYEELYWVQNTKNNQFVLSGTEKFTTIKPGYTVPKDHKLVPATNKDDEQLYSNVIKHNNNVLTVGASCTEYGFTKKVCKICGTEEVVDIVNPLGHKKGTEITAENKAPTCVDPGRKVYKCDRDGCTEKVYEHVNPTGHGTEKTLVTANCKEDGVSIKYITIECKCGKYTELKGTVDTNKVTIKVGKENKTFYLFDPATAEMTTKDKDNNVVLNAPETRVSTLKNIYVLVSSATYVAKNADTHAWQVASVNKQTCTENGTKIEFCAVCGAYKTTVLTATGHNFAYNYKDVKPENQKPEAAKNWVATRQPTCTVVGYYEVTCLNNCGETSSVSPEANKFKDANGHSYKTVTVLPQCKDDAATKDWDETKGYTYIICTVCGDNTNNKDERQNITSYVEEKEYSSDIVGQVHNYVAGTTDTHTIKAGSCTEKGFFTFECDDCGRDILVVEGNTGTHVKPATKNDSNYVAYKAPTCCTVGNQERYVCARCGKWNISAEDAEIAKTAHVYKLVISAVAAQCTNDKDDAKEGKIVAGYINVYTCTAKGCDSNKFYYYGDTGLDDKDGKDIWDYLLLTDPETGKAIDWTWVFKKDGNGNRTDKIADDAKVKTHAKVATTTSHSYKAQDGKAYTCTTDGYSNYDKCTKCGDIKGKTVKTAKHDDVVSKDVPATCTTAGYTINTCPKCDYVEVTGYVEVLGHKLGDEITVTGSCSTTPSYKYKECSRANCPAGGKVLTTGYTYHEHKNADGLVLGVIDAAKFEKDGTVVQLTTICTAGLDKDARTCKACGWEAAADHHIEKITNVDATCTTAGYTVVTCAGCQEALKETEINAPALNHKIGDTDAWVEIDRDPATETATGTIYYECSLCKATKTEVIPPVSTIYLDLTYANANGKEGFAEYSLITVNVLLSSKKAAIRTLSYELNYDETKLEFVSANFDNTFSIASINDTVVDEATGDRAVKFAGMSPNAVEVGEAAVIATITFRAIAAGTTESFEFANAEAYLEAGAKVEVNKDIDNADTKDVDESKITIATLMDVYTEDVVTIDMQDALAIYDLMTNSEYNVAADLDKDGEITANDLQLFYSIFVGTMKKEALRNYEVN